MGCWEFTNYHFHEILTNKHDSAVFNDSEAKDTKRSSNDVGNHCEFACPEKRWKDSALHLKPDIQSLSQEPFLLGCFLSTTSVSRLSVNAELEFFTKTIKMAYPSNLVALLFVLFTTYQIQAWKITVESITIFKDFEDGGRPGKLRMSHIF